MSRCEDREAGCSGGGSNLDEGVPAADLDLLRRQIIGGETCPDVDLFAHQHFAAQALGQTLQARGDVDRIADRRELCVALITNVACGSETRVDADAEANGLEQPVGKAAVELLDIGRDYRSRDDRRPTSFLWKPCEPK